MSENSNTFKKITTGPNDDDHRVTITDSTELDQDGMLPTEQETASESHTENPHNETAEEAIPKTNKYEKVHVDQDSSQHIISTTSATIHAVDVSATEGSRQGLTQMNNQSVQAMFQSYSNLPGRGHMAQNTSSVTTGQNFQGQGHRLADDGMTQSGAQR